MTFSEGKSCVKYAHDFPNNNIHEGYNNTSWIHQIHGEYPPKLPKNQHSPLARRVFFVVRSSSINISNIIISNISINSNSGNSISINGININSIRSSSYSRHQQRGKFTSGHLASSVSWQSIYIVIGSSSMQQQHPHLHAEDILIFTQKISLSSHRRYACLHTEDLSRGWSSPSLSARNIY